MSSEKFIIDEEELKKAKARTQTGHGQILVLETGRPPRIFVPTNIFGYLSWTALQDGADGAERIDIDYGNDLTNGSHDRYYPGGGLFFYRDRDGRNYFSPVSGHLNVIVERPEFGVAFKHSGTLINVRLESDGHAVVLNGTYEISSV